MQSAKPVDDGERELLARARRLDPQALGQVYDAYFERLYRFAYPFVGDPAAAQDIASEALRRFLEAARRGRAPDYNLAAWLYRVARNLAVDAHRRAPPGGSVPFEPELNQAGSVDTEASAERRMDRSRVRAALAGLTADQQHVILLKFVEGYSNAEIGALLRKPEGAVKSLQHRALSALRRLLDAPGARGQGPGEV
jgi:RNA polymerase sigma-70 factor (ECF subfamily)